MKKTPQLQNPDSRHTGTSRLGFSLLELLVVISITAVLTAIVLPITRAGLERGKQARCASNLRQLYLANTAYADDFDHYVAAAQDIKTSQNKTRWHGRRSSQTKPFDAQTGPLARYLGSDKMIRACQPAGGFRHDVAANAFESSCGGYGYNDRGVGSEVYLYGYTEQGVKKGMKPGNIQNPAQTVMFCDTAFPQPYDQPEYLIEYSFAEAYRFVDGNPPAASGQATPSINFRHMGKANVVWCDGHVSAESMTMEYNPDFTKFNIGWFGGPNNDLFDPF